MFRLDSENSHARAAHGTIGAAFLVFLSDIIDLSNLTHQHFHLDIIDKLFILVAVAKSKDLAARNSPSSEGGYLLQKSTISDVALTNTLTFIYFITVHYYLFAP